MPSVQYPPLSPRSIPPVQYPRSIPYWTEGCRISTGDRGFWHIPISFSYIFTKSYFIGVRMSLRHDDCSLYPLARFLWALVFIHATGHLVDSTGNAESWFHLIPWMDGDCTQERQACIKRLQRVRGAVGVGWPGWWAGPGRGIGQGPREESRHSRRDLFQLPGIL